MHYSLGGRKNAERYKRFMDEFPGLFTQVRIDPDGSAFNNFATLLVERIKFHEREGQSVAERSTRRECIAV